MDHFFEPWTRRLAGSSVLVEGDEHPLSDVSRPDFLGGSYSTAIAGEGGAGSRAVHVRLRTPVASGGAFIGARRIRMSMPRHTPVPARRGSGLRPSAQAVTALASTGATAARRGRSARA